MNKTKINKSNAFKRSRKTYIVQKSNMEDEDDSDKINVLAEEKLASSSKNQNQILDNVKNKSQNAMLGPCVYTECDIGGVHLPPEIIDIIFSFLPKPFDPNILLVNKTFYNIAMPYLYSCPLLNSSNFEVFIRTMASTEGRKRNLGSLVTILDLSQIVHSGKNSFTAKLLRRCSKNLEVFVAPQRSFGYSPLVSLRQCKRIKKLDLSLVSEQVDLQQLFQAIKGAKYLKSLSFPRSSVSCVDYDNLWPPNLSHLRLAGGISDEFIKNTQFPLTIKSLEVAHCPFLSGAAVRSLCRRLGPVLTHLSIKSPLLKLHSNSLDSVLALCPNLTHLSISCDYFTSDMFSEIYLHTSSKNPNEDSNESDRDDENNIVPPLNNIHHNGRPHPLETLSIDASGMIMLDQSVLHPDDILIPLMEERLTKLRTVRISRTLNWNIKSDDVIDLGDALNDLGGGLWLF